MPDAVANSIVTSNSTVNVANATSYLYNATEMSYADGIKANHTLLMGTKVCFSPGSFDMLDVLTLR